MPVLHPGLADARRLSIYKVRQQEERIVYSRTLRPHKSPSATGLLHMVHWTLSLEATSITIPSFLAKELVLLWLPCVASYDAVRAISTL